MKSKVLAGSLLLLYIFDFKFRLVLHRDFRVYSTIYRFTHGSFCASFCSSTTQNALSILISVKSRCSSLIILAWMGRHTHSSHHQLFQRSDHASWWTPSSWCDLPACWAGRCRCSSWCLALWQTPSACPWWKRVFGRLQSKALSTFWSSTIPIQLRSNTYEQVI